MDKAVKGWGGGGRGRMGGGERDERKYSFSEFLKFVNESLSCYLYKQQCSTSEEINRSCQVFANCR